MAFQERQNGISILLCSYNGENKITPTLEKILQQEFLQPINWEVIFVDNNSTDATKDLVRSYSQNFAAKSIPFKILLEPKKGKFHALNLGIAQARYAYFIIVDDDNWVQNNYVQKAYELIHSNPNIGAIGCYSEPVFEKDSPQQPTWLHEDPERLALGNQGKEGFDNSRKHLWGAGMVSRTDIYAKLYSEYPSLLFDNDIEDIYIAEDTEYCLRLVLKGYELHYSSQLKIKHFMPNERLTDEYWTNLNNKINNSFKIIDLYHAIWKLRSKKYESKFAKTRLRIVTPLRYLFSINKLKRKRNKILLGFLYPSTTFNTKCISILNAFLNDKSLINPNTLKQAESHENS